MAHCIHHEACTTTEQRCRGNRPPGEDAARVAHRPSTQLLARALPLSVTSCSRNERGEMLSHVPQWQPPAPPAEPSLTLQPSNRWAGTPLVKQRKRKNDRAGGGGKRSNAEANGSQQRGDDDDQLKQEEQTASQADESQTAAADGGSQDESAAAAAAGGADEDESADREVAGATVKTCQLVYPSNRGNRRLAGLVKSMSACYMEIQGISQCKLRELWYEDKQLFRRKEYSDSTLGLLSSILQVQRGDLGVVAASKGFVMGELSYKLDTLSDAPGSGVQLVNCEWPQPLTPDVKQIRGKQRQAAKKPRASMSGIVSHCVLRSSLYAQT